MIRYDIAQVAARKKPRARGTTANLPPVHGSVGCEQSYYRALRKMLSGIRNAIARDILPALASERRQQRLERRLRDVEEGSFAGIRALTAELTRQANSTVERILQLESERHTTQFMQSAHKALGVDLTAVVRQEDLGDYLRAAAARNTSLISSLSTNTVKQVEQAVLAAGIRGDSVQALKAVLTNQLGIADRRAQLIARDQTAKLNSDLNKIRQQQAGIDRYTWLTSHDERVRPLHQGLDGKVYDWGKPTGAEDGLPPGQPIQCRCVARGIVIFDEPVKSRARKVEPTIEPTPAERNSVLDLTSKRYVVDEGIKDGKEHLAAYDAVTGDKIKNIDSDRQSFVAFSDEMTAMISDPKRAVIAHHNHPSSGSFSNADLTMLHLFPGFSEIWAHGHNGSSYRARRAAKRLVSYDFERAKNQVKASLDIDVPSYFGTDTIAANAAVNPIYYHLVSLVLDKKGFIEYSADLAGSAKVTWEKHRAFWQKIIDRIGKDS
jgi:SPP1 gp7 family putative phage head morphogenesis protein